MKYNKKGTTSRQRCTLCLAEQSPFVYLQVLIMNVKNIAILGSTGSIGRNALEVVARLPDRFRVSCLTVHKNIELLQAQIARFRPTVVVVEDEECAGSIRSRVNGSTQVLSGRAGMMNAVTRSDVDIVVSALVGFAGLEPTLRAIEAGKNIALANKETLVVAGEIIMRKVREHGVRLLPIDSEHSAILQCLQGEDMSTVERLILTGSGGPFLHFKPHEFERITVAQALNHPTWKMGNKITIDSATLMNKGLEVIEAFWLFGLPAEKISVVIHPQSIIHSMVEFVDGSIKAQLGIPDMKLPIQYALTYPERPSTPFQRIDFHSLQQMTFFPPDGEKFRCFPLAFKALAMGGTAPAALNAANEVAVKLFLEEKIPFACIPEFIEGTLATHIPIRPYTLEDVIRVDRETREAVLQQYVPMN